MKSTDLFRFGISTLLALGCSAGYSFCAGEGGGRPQRGEALRGKFLPPEGKVLFFAGQNMESIDGYVKSAGIMPAGLMHYTSVQDADALDEVFDCGSGDSCGRYLLDKYPGTALQIGLYMVDVLDDIAAGKYDTNIDRIGAWIKDTKRPVYLRIGYEFDGPHNHYEPSAYVKAYRYIVDRFHRNGVDNAAYVWHSFAAEASRPLTDWYPGDGYVDWFGISVFAQDEKEMLPMIDLAKEHRKPMMVAEATPAGIGTASGEAAWERWFKRYFDLIEKHDIRAFCYINYDWDVLPMFKDLHWKDTRLSTSSFILGKWIEELKKDKYLNCSPGLFSLLGFTPEE